MTTTTVQPIFGSSAALTTTHLQSLAYSSTKLGAWSSDVIDNSSNLSDDEIISVLLKMGTSPSGLCEIWGWEVMDDTPTYPDTVTGSEGTITLTSMREKVSNFKYVNEVYVDTTSSRIYPVTFRLTEIFGSMPKKWGLLIINVATVALASSGNVVTRTPIQWQLV